jgi:hypothetical protein
MFLLTLASACHAASVPVDLSGIRSGPIQVSSTPDSVTVNWVDEASRRWRADFSLDPAKPLITSISSENKTIIDRAQPIYRCATGKRRGGWDAFFDFPPSHPDGTRNFQGEFKLSAARALTAGDRVTLTFDGFHMGIFDGAITYTFYPDSRLIQQQAVVKTNEQDVAFYYDTGLRMTADSDRRPGNNMESQIAYYDTNGQFQTTQSNGSDRENLAVRYRTIAARTENGSVAVFPAPHQYFFARDYTTNMANLWHVEWRGAVSIGVRQLPDDNSPYYPWMNAPPGTEQHLGVFYLLSTAKPKEVLEDVLRYTNKDRFPALPGYKTFAPHWHLAYTVQAIAKGPDWVPPFKPVMKAMGIDAAMIMDFHGDGHPADLTNVRLEELDAYFRVTRAQTDPKFLLIPAEEANVHLGGHWAIVFPKPVYWHMNRKADTPFQESDPRYGKVYNIANEKELLDMVRLENGFMYQTHPRTKGSTGFPDKIRETEHFRDPRYLGAGWKAMPSDLSSPRLGERSLKLVDDMNNWGMQKRIMGEVDVFQLDSTHELYAHMNVNYVRMPGLPTYDNYGQLLNAVAKGDFFITTGEVLLPEVNISTADPDAISVKANVINTFPLQMAEIVWGDGSETHRQIFPLTRTHAFSIGSMEHRTTAKGWKWARFAVWDVAGNGAFVNPVTR